MHDKDLAVVVSQPLYGIETAGPDRGLVRIAVSVCVLDQSDLVPADDFFAQPGHVIMSQENRVRAWTQCKDRWVLDQWIASEERGFELRRYLKRRKSLFCLRTGSS